MTFYKTQIGDAPVKALNHLYSVNRIQMIWNVNYSTAISRLRKCGWQNFRFNHIYTYKNRPVSVESFKAITGASIQPDSTTPEILKLYVNSNMYGKVLGLTPNRAITQWLKYPNADYVKISTVILDGNSEPITSKDVTKTIKNPPRMGAPLKLDDVNMQLI